MAGVFNQPEALFQHLVNDLQNELTIVTISVSGKDLNAANVAEQFYNETASPVGQTRFLHYCIVWLHNNNSAEKVISDAPTNDQYMRAWEELKRYRNKPGRTKAKYLRCLAEFGKHLLLRGILPVRARPGSTPASAESSQSRAPQLRNNCFRRDGNRCVVSGAFNQMEAQDRAAPYLDDDNVPIANNTRGFDKLEVAHIIPHALGWRDNADSNSIRPHLNVYLILDMFCPGAMERYRGSAIDCPENAITLTSNRHELFGGLRIYFDPIHGSNQNYMVHHVSEPLIVLPEYPRNINFRAVTNISLPDPDLLAIHRACARVAHATGAGEVGERFFRDLSGGHATAADGVDPT